MTLDPDTLENFKSVAKMLDIQSNVNARVEAMFKHVIQLISLLDEAEKLHGNVLHQLVTDVEAIKLAKKTD